MQMLKSKGRTRQDTEKVAKRNISAPELAALLATLLDRLGVSERTVATAFDWGTSPEGFAFWLEVYLTLYAIRGAEPDANA